MSTILQARQDVIKKLNVMVRKIQGITSFILTGSKQCPPSDIHVVIGTDDSSAAPKIYSDINFLISEFLSPRSFNYTESDNRIIKNYSFDSGVRAEVTVCSEDNFPAAEWWVSYIDKNGAALAFYGEESKCDTDPITDESVAQPENELDNDAFDDFTDDFDDDFDTLSDDIPSIEPSAEGAMVGEFSNDFTLDEISNEEEISSEPEKTPDEIWKQIYSKVSLAKSAIAGGSVIRAGETINELRTQLIELICNQNGITENYIHSIDLLPNNCQKALAKTYPSKLESSAMISALAAELSLFEQLIK